MSLKSATEPIAAPNSDIADTVHAAPTTAELPQPISTTAATGRAAEPAGGAPGFPRAPVTPHAARSTQSLAARLTAWYAASAFALILAATGVLYIALERGLDADNDRLLADRIEDVRSVLKNHQDPRTELADQADDTPSPRLHSPVYFRIIDGEGAVVLQSRSMAETLPPTLFPPALSLDGFGDGVQVRTAGGPPLPAPAGPPPPRGGAP